MLETKKISEMLAVTINSITDEIIEHNPKTVARLLDNYESLTRHIDEKNFSQIESNLTNVRDLPSQIKYHRDEIDTINFNYTLTPSAESKLRMAINIKRSLERDLESAQNFLNMNQDNVELFNLINNHVLYFLELVAKNTELYFEDLAQGNLDFSSKRLLVIEDLTSLLNKLSQRYNINIDR